LLTPVLCGALIIAALGYLLNRALKA